MGFVWEASHVFTHTRFALKFLKGAKEEDRRRFQREVRAAAAVRHPNVVGVHDFVELPDGMLVMVMDLLEGETLGALLRREGRLSLAALVPIILPVVSALDAAHAAGIVHRDLKPENVFLAKKEGKEVEIKVLDFGVAKLTAVEGLAARSAELTNTGSMLGTPYYMAPEQVVAEKDLDARADIWSLGIVLYECLAGVRPTEGENVGRVLKRILLGDFEPITKHCKDLPADVAALISKMLVGEREDRLRDLSEVRAVLERQVGGGPRSAISARRSSLRIVLAGVGVTIAGVAAMSFGFAGQKTTATIPSSSPTIQATTATIPSATAMPEIIPEPSVAPSVTVSAPAVVPHVTAPSRRPVVPVVTPSVIAVPPAASSAPEAPKQPPPEYAKTRKD